METIVVGVTVTEASALALGIDHLLDHFLAPGARGGEQAEINDYSDRPSWSMSQLSPVLVIDIPCICLDDPSPVNSIDVLESFSR